jgi:hypothetical protein
MFSFISLLEALFLISLGTPQEMTFIAKTRHDFRAKGWL